ncbi:cobalamin biosynthesis protein CobG [Calidifontibacter terrae]
MTEPAPTACPVAARTGGDRCPGLLRPFVAADGVIIRLRVPGGFIATEVLTRLTEIAAEFGAPVVQLTSRGNLQLRALPNPLPESLIQAVEDTGLLPSASHERVRNIVADPLAPGLRSMVAELDHGLCADPELADLPGRWLFALADSAPTDAREFGVLATPWDLAYDAGSGTLHVGDHATDCSSADAVGALLDRARTFVRTPRDERAWNVRDLPAGHPIFAGLEPSPRPVAHPLLPGRYGDALIAGVPLGMLDHNHATALATLADHVTITPWRSVVIGTRSEPTGFITGESPWARLTSCVGAPWCGRTTIHTLDLTRRAALDIAPGGPPVHVSGCERRCGHPTGPYIDVLEPLTADDIRSQA